MVVVVVVAAAKALLDSHALRPVIGNSKAQLLLSTNISPNAGGKTLRSVEKN